MKHFLLLLSLLCVSLVSSTAFADRIYLFPNDGSGDNFGFVGRMNGHPLVLYGGTPSYFFGTDGYEPGSTFGGSTTLFLYSSTVWVDGMPMEFDFPATDSYIFISSFTLPTNGKDFTRFVEISFDATGINFDAGHTGPYRSRDPRYLGVGSKETKTGRHTILKSLLWEFLRSALSVKCSYASSPMCSISVSSHCTQNPAGAILSAMGFFANYRGTSQMSSHCLSDSWRHG